MLKTANPDQVAAVETVLSAPDMILIQGPPGTGKTTVIAEICYQIALRGGRTLIASQANLAVDNALSRLIHNPVIRALRKGKAERVEEEGLPFLEERVIGTWLENTSADCSSRLSMRLDTVQVFHQLLASSARFAAYLKTEEVFQEKQPLLQERKAALESEYQAKVSTYQQALDEQHEVESLKAELDALLAGITPFTNSVNWEEPATANLLIRLQPYAARENSVGNFEADVRIAIGLATELGMGPPNLSSFGVANWLRDQVPTWLAEVQTAITCANNAVTAMTKALPAIQDYREICNFVTRLQETHQQILESQQSNRREIEKLRKLRSDIESAKVELSNWSATVYGEVYGVLEKCVQGCQIQIFTEDLIPLLSRLKTIMQQFGSIHALWEPCCKKSLVEVGRLIEQRREREEVFKIAKNIYSLLVSVPHKLTYQSTDEFAISIATKELKIHSLDSVLALKKLYQVAHSTLENVNNQPYRLGGLISSPISLDRAAATLEAIKRECKIIVQRVKPSAIEATTLRCITDETVNAIVTNARDWLNQVRTETEQRLQQLEQDLDQLRELPEQISTAQTQAEILRIEAKQKSIQVVKVLQGLIHLS